MGETMKMVGGLIGKRAAHHFADNENGVFVIGRRSGVTLRLEPDPRVVLTPEEARELGCILTRMADMIDAASHTLSGSVE